MSLSVGMRKPDRLERLIQHRFGQLVGHTFDFWSLRHASWDQTNRPRFVKVMSRELKEKHCKVCGRVITWRKKWARDWDQVRYCSKACRQSGLRPEDRDLEMAIVTLLNERAAGATICPSEAARRVAPDEASWRPLMERTRMAARRLHQVGRLEILQRGRAVDPSTAKGPVRLRLVK